MTEKKYLCSYRFDGHEYNHVVISSSAEEAKARLSAMALGRVDGELIATIPGAFGGPVLLFGWLRNMLFGGRA